MKLPYILVIGDIILDHYHYATIGPINPEQPTGRVYRHTSSEARLGGAGAVASMIRDLEESVHLLAVWPEIGAPYALEDVHIQGSGPIGLVTHKHRLVVDGALQMHRLDMDTEAYDEETIKSIRRQIKEVAKDAGLIVLSDYGKGVINDAVLKTVEAVARRREIGIMVDPCRGRPWNSYGSVTLIKANRREAIIELGLQDDEAANVTTLELATRAHAQLDEHRTVVIVTEGAQGMAVVGWDGMISHWIPAWHAHEVDCCGAGDAVMAALAVAWARGMDLRQSCTLAAAVAAQQVESLGVSPLHPERLPRALLSANTLDDCSSALS